MRKRWLAGGAGVVAAGLVIALAVYAGGDRMPSGNQPTGPGSATGAISSCGLPGTPGEDARGATDSVVWDQESGWPLPVSSTDGPGLRDPQGAWSCYSRTPSGAVLAAYVISIRVGGVAGNWQEVARQQTMPGIGQDALLEGGVRTASPVTPRGFQVAGYSDDRATIRYYLHTAESDASCTIDVQWSSDDWRLVLGDDGSTATGCTLDVPTSFTPWGP